MLGEENMEAVICFEMLYPGREPADKVAAAAAAGFSGVEFWGWRDKDLEALKAACDKHEVKVANFSGQRRGSLVDRHSHHLISGELRGAVAAARLLDCSTLMLLSDELGEGGRVAESCPGLSPQEKYAGLKAGLQRARREVPDDILLVLEPLNTRIDHPGYFLNDMATAAALVREIADPGVKLLCDFYHLGVMGEDLKTVIDEFSTEIGYAHIADFPGRHEPGTGGADWPGLLRRLRASGYSGCVGFEYQPLGDSDVSLAAVRRLWDSL
jgi:hydroxypyruvate isomerase